jgi:DNA-nicking Smr family endonuclease
MEFGDILDLWDERLKQKGGKRNLPPAGEAAGKRAEGHGKPPERVDPLTAWLRINGVEDKDAAAEQAGQDRGDRRRRLLRKRPDGVIDLHGLTRDEAWTALEVFFQEGRRRGYEKLLIVHGKGNHSEGAGVLKRACRDFIERCPYAGETGRGNAAEGGSGVTWVLIKPDVPGPNVPGK